MPNGFSTAVSIYAASEASNARNAVRELEEKQRLEELRAFVATYTHANASAEDRERYAGAVRELYPVMREVTPEMRAQHRRDLKLLAGGVLGFVLAIVVAGVAGKYFCDDSADGIALFLCGVLGCVVAAVPIGFVSWAIYTLFFW